MLLDLRAGPAVHKMREISGEAQTEDTSCSLSFDANTLHIEVRATDANMADLIASPATDTDKFLYEEDCIQLAVATIRPIGLEQTLVTTTGGRAGTSGTLNWTLATEVSSEGWHISVDVPIEPETEFIGINLHRFYRGCKNEVHGIDASLPHPLLPPTFAVVILDGSESADAVETTYREAQDNDAARNITDSLAQARDRVAKANRLGGPDISLDTAIELAHRREALAVRPSEGFLSWNEAYYLAALIDLWELTEDRIWIESAMLRIEEVWKLRSDRTNELDSVTNKALPTWYNDAETGSPCTLTSGTILNPIARLIRTVHETDQLSDMRSDISHWIPLCDETLCLHDNEWIEFPDGSGMHIEPCQKGPRRIYPSGGSRINPLNREFWFSMPMLNIGMVTRNKEYLRKVAMNALFFKNTSEVTDDCLYWEYEVSRYPSVGEDISHAHSQWLFAEQCQRDGIVLTVEDLGRIANMFDKDIFRHSDVPCGTVRGYDPDLHLAVGVWSSICRYKPHLLERVETVVGTIMQEEGDEFSDGWSIRNLTCLLKAQALVT